MACLLPASCGLCSVSVRNFSARLPINTMLGMEMSQSLLTRRMNNKPETLWLLPSIICCTIYFLPFYKIYVIVNPMRNLANLAPLCNLRTSLTLSIRTGLKFSMTEFGHQRCCFQPSWLYRGEDTKSRLRMQYTFHSHATEKDITACVQQSPFTIQIWNLATEVSFFILFYICHQEKIISNSKSQLLVGQPLSHSRKDWLQSVH